MIFTRIVKPDFTLYVCGLAWSGATKGEPPPEHLILTGAIVCDGPRCVCHELRSTQPPAPERPTP